MKTISWLIPIHFILKKHPLWCILLSDNDMVSFVIWKNMHSWVFNHFKLNPSFFEKPTRAYFSNCTGHHIITYTNQFKVLEVVWAFFLKESHDIIITMSILHDVATCHEILEQQCGFTENFLKGANIAYRCICCSVKSHIIGKLVQWKPVEWQVPCRQRAVIPEVRLRVAKSASYDLVFMVIFYYRLSKRKQCNALVFLILHCGYLNHFDLLYLEDFLSWINVWFCSYFLQEFYHCT